MDDREAIEKTLNGATEAFGVLVSRYQSRVYAVALARVYDHQDAQDLSQEAFLRAYEGLPMLKNHDAFAPWLFMVLRHLCVDFVRGKWRRERVTQMLPGSESFAEPSTDPRQKMDTVETARTLWSQVGQLDDTSREVLSLHYGQELKVSEIAALTAMKESTVKMRLQKARAVLGDRIGDLKGAWGIAPSSAFSGGVMKTIAAEAPLKEGIAATPVVGGLLAGLAMLWWSNMRDVRRWRNHTPAGMLAQRRRTIVRGILLFAAALMLALLFAFVVVFALARPLGRPLTLWVPCGVIYGVIMAVLLGAIFKREIDLLSPREKVKQFANAGLAILMIAAICLFPAHKPIALGVFLALQYFFPNKSNVALATVPPGFWVAPLLKRTDTGDVHALPVAKKQLRSWLTMLHEYGLVAPPLVNGKEDFRVRLRLKGSLFEKMASGAHSSSLLVNTQGIVSCCIVPRDYVALIQHLGLDTPPGRQELAAKLGESFARALAAYAEGGDKVAVANSLGLNLCPMDATKTHTFTLIKYVLPLVGVVLVAIAVLGWLT